MPPAPRPARRKDLVDEVKQLLRVQLLVPKDGKPPGIDGYRGKGPLRGWVRITATRELIRHKKKRAREVPIEQAASIACSTSGIDPALAAMKAEYRAEFAVALREAIEDLGAEDRTLLRQQIVDDMSIDAVGARLRRPPRDRRALAQPRPRRAGRRDAPPARRAPRAAGRSDRERDPARRSRSSTRA